METNNDFTDHLPQPDGAGQPPTRNHAGQWVKGVSGNPEGRTAGTGSIVVEIRRLMQSDCDGQPLARKIALRLVELARNGDLRAIRELLDRMDGPPRVDPSASEPVVFAPITIRRVARVGDPSDCAARG